mmetsp:Transcript_27626/g.58794  ORF Transcript_27626/g.58794 Transcript_27626/m.58794 type:complete len:216 (+) Transcript_27626:3-650(+)
MLCSQEERAARPVVVGAQGEAAIARTLQAIARASEDGRALEFSVRAAAEDDDEGQHPFRGDWIRFQAVSKCTWTKFRRMWDAFGKMRKADAASDDTSATSPVVSSKKKQRKLKVAGHTQPGKLAKAILNEERQWLGVVLEVNPDDEEAMFIAMLSLCELRDLAAEDPFVCVPRWPAAHGGGRVYLHTFREGTSRRYEEHGQRKRRASSENSETKT